MFRARRICAAQFVQRTPEGVQTKIRFARRAFDTIEKGRQVDQFRTRFKEVQLQ